MASSDNNQINDQPMENDESVQVDEQTVENPEETAANGQDQSPKSKQKIINNDDSKLFVGGMSAETTEKDLRDHFGKYGEIKNIIVKIDAATGRSRGFAFIIFTSAETIDKVLAVGDHTINNKKVDPKKAKVKHGKVFVGGITAEMSDEDIKSCFSKFGNIVQVEFPFDKIKKQRKGFCFVTFDSEQVVRGLLKSPKPTINGKEVDVKKATPKPEGMENGRGPLVRGGGRGGHGRGFFGAVAQNWGQQSYGGGFDYYGQGYGGAAEVYGNSGYGNFGFPDANNGGFNRGKQRGGRGGFNAQRNQPY